MSAIEDFKKLLDERGEECWDMQTRGLWFGIKGNDHKYEAHEQRNGLILIEAGDLTPEQAIAATLGRDECDVSYEQDGIPRCSVCENVLYDEYKKGDGIKNYCDECGAKVRKGAER